MNFLDFFHHKGNQSWQHCNVLQSSRTNYSQCTMENKDVRSRSGDILSSSNTKTHKLWRKRALYGILEVFRGHYMKYYYVFITDHSSCIRGFRMRTWMRDFINYSCNEMLKKCYGRAVKNFDAKLTHGHLFKH